MTENKFCISVATDFESLSYNYSSFEIWTLVQIWLLTACNSTILINLKEGVAGAGHNIKEKRRQNAEIALGNGYFRPLGHSKLCAGGRSENLWRDKEKNNAFFKKRFFFWCCLKIQQSEIWYAGLLGRWIKLVVDQASAVPSIFFLISYRCRALKTFYFHFCTFIRK